MAQKVLVIADLVVDFTLAQAVVCMQGQGADCTLAQAVDCTLAQAAESMKGRLPITAIKDHGVPASLESKVSNGRVRTALNSKRSMSV